MMPITAEPRAKRIVNIELSIKRFLLCRVWWTACRLQGTPGLRFQAGYAGENRNNRNSKLSATSPKKPSGSIYAILNFLFRFNLLDGEPAAGEPHSTEKGCYFVPVPAPTNTLPL